MENQTDFFSKTSNIKKIKGILLMTAAMHAWLILVFAVMGTYSMSLINVLSVVIYIYALHIVSEKNVAMIFYIAFAEVTLHSILSVIFVGTSFGFHMYLFVLVLVSFYLMYQGNPLRITLKISASACIIATSAFVMCYLSGGYSIQAYNQRAVTFKSLIYIVNILFVYVVLTLFSFLFLQENKRYQQKAREENQRLEQLASKDSLTGLCNRRNIRDIFNRLTEGNTIFSVIMCDIDNFKKINDDYGHECGDVILQRISKILVDSVPEDSYVGRWGGEELIVIVVNHTGRMTGALAEKIRKKMEEDHVRYKRKMVPYTVTFGVSEYRKGEKLHATLNRADKSMYAGKKKGKNCVTYDE